MATRRNSTNSSPKNAVGTNGADCEMFVCSSESLRFLHGASSRDPEIRRQSLQLICKTLDGWFEGYGSPPVSHCSKELEASFDLKQLIVEQLPDILRLSIDCPFPDVQETCSSILSDLQDRGMKIPQPIVHFASSFIPEIETGFSGKDDQSKSLLIDAFLQNNRLEHVFQIMAYHPIYLEHFLRAHHHVLYGDGPLPFNYRHYIAIMAAAEHRCSYLIQIHSKEFLLQHGDKQWLKGLDHVPDKLRSLSEVNRILAHRPWLMNRSYLQKLSKATWSVSEMLHAIALLAHIHALTSFIFGCGVTAELDQEFEGYTYNVECSNGDIENAKQLIFNGRNTVPLLQSPGEDSSVEELLIKMRHLNETGSSAGSDETILPATEKYHDYCQCSRFVDDPHYAYEDSGKRDDRNGALTLIAAEFSWEVHGYSLANLLCIDVATMLDEKFNVVHNLTYNTMGDLTNVDTTAFRQAIWNYTHCLFGIRQDDYDYSIVNQLLKRSLQSFIKTVSCFPERVTEADYDTCVINVRHSEKVHVNLILLEARLQAELLYGLRAVHDL